MKRRGKAREKQLAKWERNPAQKYAVVLIMLAVVSVLLVVGVEWIQRGSLAETTVWAVQNGKLLAMNALINLCVLVIFYMLFNSIMAGTAVATLLLFIMALITYFKTKLIGEPFFPWDIFLKKESMNIIPLVTGAEAIKRLSVVGVIVLVLVVLCFYWPRLRVGKGSRIALGLLSLFALYSLGVRTPWAGQLINKMGVSEIVWNQQENYANNGMALAFTMNVKNAIVPKPEGYGEPAMAALAQNLADQSAVQTASAKKSDPFQGKQPNVIFIMNEAFWDPTLLPNVQFSEDPIPTVHKLQKESTSGYLLSPQFGGGTSNVEFEVLTGQSMSFLPDGSVPYQQYINKPVPSLASYFETQGYKSMGIHSYEGWFWNRENVYKQLGFQSFMSKDQFDNPEYKGTFISDDEVSRQIIKQVDETEKPMFIYAVTMQNHGPYDDNRYGGNSISAEGDLTASAKNTLETYTQGAHDADQSLQKLIDHFEQSDEPTVVVFYGDHLPMLGMDYDVYKQGGMINSSSQWSLEETKSMHSVPFVMWSNVGLPQEHVPSLSDSFLGTYVLNKLGMEKPASLAINDALLQQTPGLLRDLVVDANGSLYRSVPEQYQPLVSQYSDLQYDQLFGKQYLAKYIDQDYLTKEALPDYNQEFALPPVTESQEPSENQGS
ncbi:LTA synthase family protein [Paenibacillus sp. NPDC056579]|uniref:LTA synthase family protein n=1 Tax=Paenibacillus sp. NPDC056579 TaxID=3345871 RepID=UPI0036B1CECA